MTLFREILIYGFIAVASSLLLLNVFFRTYTYFDLTTDQRMQLFFSGNVVLFKKLLFGFFLKKIKNIIITANLQKMHFIIAFTTMWSMLILSLLLIKFWFTTLAANTDMKLMPFNVSIYSELQSSLLCVLKQFISFFFF